MFLAMAAASSPATDFVSEVEQEILVDLESSPDESEHGRRDDAEADAPPVVSSGLYADTDGEAPAAADPATADVDPASDVPAGEFVTAAVAHAAAEPATAIDSAQPRSSSWLRIL